MLSVLSLGEVTGDIRYRSSHVISVSGQLQTYSGVFETFGIPFEPLLGGDRVRWVCVRVSRRTVPSADTAEPMLNIPRPDQLTDFYSISVARFVQVGCSQQVAGPSFKRTRQ